MDSIANRAALRRLPALFMAMIMSLLAGCGGGGGDGGGAAAPAVVPITITSQPSSVNVLAGASANFTVTATGDGPAYQWQLSTDGGAVWSSVAGATAASFATSAVDLSFSGRQYRVVVSGAANAVTSSAVTLTVTAAQVAPAITVQPVSQTAVAGTDASFSVTASGTSLTYQWQSGPDGSTWANVSGATTATLALSAVAASDNGKHLRVLVVNAAGSTASDGAATLTVTAASVAPQINTQAQSAGVVVPQTATFTVVASGTPAPSYQWQKSTGGGAFTDIAGATAANYTTAATTTADNGTSFRVRVSNAAGTVLGNAVTLTVAATGVAPAFNVDSADFSVLALEPALFTTHANGTPTPSYQWQSSSDAGLTFANINGATAASYTFTPTTLSGNGLYYRAVATNSVGSATSHAAKLTIYNPGIGGMVAGVAMDSSGNLYATVYADTIGVVSTFRTSTFYGIRKVDTHGVVTTLAGNNTRASVNGTGAAASFVTPLGIVVDSVGNVFVADAGVSAIRKITPAGVVTTFAGGNANGGYTEGTGTQASFHGPVNLAIDAADNIYVADSFNNAIRKITPAGVVTTLAGGGSTSVIMVDGTGSAATFAGPRGVAADASGNVFVADTSHHAIRKITPAGVVTTLAGGVGVGLIDGTGGAAGFKYPGAIAVDSSGVLWVVDTNNQALRRVTQAGVVTTFSANDIAANSIIVDAAGNLYTDFNYGFFSTFAPYEIRKLTPTKVATAIPDCCYKAP